MKSSGQKGLTLVDFLIVLGIVVMAISLAVKAPSLFERSYRSNCMMNQARLDDLLYKALNEDHKEITQVALAYTVTYRDPGKAPVLAVLYSPSGDGYFKEFKTMEIPAEIRSMNHLICPTHQKTEHSVSIIDYAYLWGRWRCLWSKEHN